MGSPTRAQASPNHTLVTGNRRRAIIYLLLSLLIAAVAGILTYQYLFQVRAAALPSREVVVALAAIDPGEAIEPAQVGVRQVPEIILPEDHLVSIQEAVGQRAAFPIQANEIILGSRLQDGSGGPLSRRLTGDRWAMILRSEWLAAPLPEVSNGDRLDLLAVQQAKPLEEAGVIVSAVEILEVSQTKDSGGQWTLAVTVEEALAILYARVNGFSLIGLLRPGGR